MYLRPQRKCSAADVLYGTKTSSALIACGVPPSQLGIITLYKQQIKVLNERIHGTTANLEHVRSGLAKQMQEIEILTADKSQGRDKDCILMTLVRSNEEREVSDGIHRLAHAHPSRNLTRTPKLIKGNVYRLARS